VVLALLHAVVGIMPISLHIASYCFISSVLLRLGFAFWMCCLLCWEVVERGVRVVVVACLYLYIASSRYSGTLKY